MQFVCISILAGGLQSCETEIPPEDPTPPKFSLRIIGDGFDHTFNQDSDFGNIRLMLHRNTTYDFIFSGSDDGGVERVQWGIERNSNIQVNSRIPSPWTHTYRNPFEYIEWNGDSSNPLTGAIVGGSFKTFDSRELITFIFNVSDFGGQGRQPNYVSKELSISTGNVHHTWIKNL